MGCTGVTLKISRLPRLIFECVRSPLATRLHLFVSRFFMSKSSRDLAFW